MATNKAITMPQLDMENPTAQFQVKEHPIPQPGAGEVLVKLILRPVNPADIFSIMGVYPGFQPKEGVTIVPGLEGVGVVEALGQGVTKFEIGQRVVGTPFPSVPGGSGTWQQFLVAPESDLLAVADAISDEAAAQFWVNPVTVVGMLRELAVPKGEYLLQTGAGSVLGRMVIAVAAHRGIKTINVVRRKELGDELKALGADEVIVSTEEDVVARVKEITGGNGAWGGLDCVGGDLFCSVASSVRNGGTALIYGAMSGLSASFSIPDPLFRGIKITGFWLIPYMEGKTAEEQQDVLAEVTSLLSDAIIVPYSGEKFPLEKAAEAVAEAIKPARGGKVLLEG